MADAFLQGQIAQAMAALTAVRTDLLCDEGHVVRPAEVEQTPDLDPDTGLPVLPDGDTVYSEMPCVVSDPSTGIRGRTGTVLDEAGVPSARILKTTHDYSLLPGDLFTVDLAPFSPSLVGDTFVIVGEEERSYATYRRYFMRGSSWRSS